MTEAHALVIETTRTFDSTVRFINRLLDNFYSYKNLKSYVTEKYCQKKSIKKKDFKNYDLSKSMKNHNSRNKHRSEKNLKKHNLETNQENKRIEQDSKNKQHKIEIELDSQFSDTVFFAEAYIKNKLQFTGKCTIDKNTMFIIYKSKKNCIKPYYMVRNDQKHKILSIFYNHSKERKLIQSFNSNDKEIQINKKEKNEKKTVLLTGPPGMGKTTMAEAVFLRVMLRKDSVLCNQSNVNEDLTKNENLKVNHKSNINKSKNENLKVNHKSNINKSKNENLKVNHKSNINKSKINESKVNHKSNINKSKNNESKVNHKSKINELNAKNGVKIFFYRHQNKKDSESEKVRNTVFKKVNCSVFVSKYFGESSQLINQFFSSNRNTLLLFDEIDSLLLPRNTNNPCDSIRMVNTFLLEMDKKKNDMIFTSNIETLDRAVIDRCYNLSVDCLETDIEHLDRQTITYHLEGQTIRQHFDKEFSDNKTNGQQTGETIRDKYGIIVRNTLRDEMLKGKRPFKNISRYISRLMRDSRLFLREGESIRQLKKRIINNIL
ncbi:hypothetical protein M153_2200035183 [Pseudoloma neurophilia]|uniref:AAA+ ATPase domain-containing protein n=1 Tax=Pseudoloma neurophilia TaxID=146866 RepID=A0A0R0M4Y8_9MICR|nr:hypothetical protein M153_2200035183 [Pseudoloma neurophilia]